MYFRLFVYEICLFGILLCIEPTAATRVCRFKYCNLSTCYSDYCNVYITCNSGNIIYVSKVLYGINQYWFSTKYCGYVCYGDVKPNPNVANEIMKLCNGKLRCSLSHWNTDNSWNLDVTYECQGNNFTTSPTKLSSSFGQHTYKSRTKAASKTTLNISTGTSTTSIPTSNNDTSSFAAPEADTNDSSDRVSEVTVASSITTGIFVLLIVSTGIVCIKRRKANKEKIVNTQGRQNAIIHRPYNETEPSSNSTDPAERNSYIYDYATANIATNTRHENIYNTLHETTKPLRGDQIYNHIPNKLSAVNETFTKPNEGVYNTLNETNTNLNYDTHYDHVSNKS